jgi:hypothetical protein
MKEQVPTKPVSVRWLMSAPAFERGVRDARAGKPYPASFNDWETNECWGYERGRQWAVRVPTSVVLKRNGRVTTEAVQWFVRLGDDIL